MAALDEDAVTAAVRLEVGNPITDELADTVIQRKIKHAVRRYNRTLAGSALKISYFETVADQQAYTIPAGVERIVDVFWNTDLNYDDEFGDGFPGAVSSEFEDRDVNFRSLGLITEMKVKQLRDIATSGYDWMIVDGKIYLDPDPDETGVKVYYFYTSTSDDVTTLDDSDEELIILFASAECLRVLAATRANVGSIDREGIAAYSGSRDLRMLADEKMRQYEELLADRIARGTV